MLKFTFKSLILFLTLFGLVILTSKLTGLPSLSDLFALKGSAQYNILLTLTCITFGSYALGSIPFGLIFTKISGLTDLRKVGSGNIGATNVLRAGGKKLAALTLLFDALKGAVCVLVIQSGLIDNLFTEPPSDHSTLSLLAASSALLGHLYPVWLSYRGGKGIATLAGLLLSLSLGTWCIACALWAAVFWKTRISSLAAVFALVALPPAGFFIENMTFSLWLAGTSALLLWRHKDNIKRLISGQEKAITSQSNQSS